MTERQQTAEGAGVCWGEGCFLSGIRILVEEWDPM